jgi:hypothetical protein
VLHTLAGAWPHVLYSLYYHTGPSHAPADKDTMQAEPPKGRPPNVLHTLAATNGGNSSPSGNTEKHTDKSFGSAKITAVQQCCRFLKPGKPLSQLLPSRMTSPRSHPKRNQKSDCLRNPPSTRHTTGCCNSSSSGHRCISSCPTSSFQVPPSCTFANAQHTNTRPRALLPTADHPDVPANTPQAPTCSKSMQWHILRAWPC